MRTFTINLLRVGIAACLTALIAIVAAHGQRTTPCADAACNGMVFSGGTCPQAPAFIARTNGTENNSLLTTAICNLVSINALQHMDWLYMGVMNAEINSRLNWAQNAFTLVPHGSISFTPNQGWIGDGSTGYYDTTWAPSLNTLHVARDSATLGLCVVANRPVTQFYDPLSVSDNTNFLALAPYYGDGLTHYNINDGGGVSYTASNAQGSWITQRTLPNLKSLYLNKNLVATDSTASTGLPTGSTTMTILAANNAGTVSGWSHDQTADAFAGDATLSVSGVFDILHAYVQGAGQTTACYLIMVLVVPAPVRQKSRPRTADALLEEA